METMFIGGSAGGPAARSAERSPATRRSLPPVPRPASERLAPERAATERVHAEQAAPAPRRPGQAAPEPRRPGEAAPEPPAVARPDAQEVAQQFVARLRAAARDFAAAAGAETAVVREAVPPARHRRSRCRVVLRDAGGAETDLIFVGPADRAGPGEQPRFEVAIQRWLGSGRPRRDAWVLRDPDAPDGVAIDVSAWLAAS